MKLIVFTSICSISLALYILGQFVRAYRAFLCVMDFEML